MADVAHVDLRPLGADDADAVFEMMREPDAVAQAAFTVPDPSDRVAFDGWLARNLSDPRVGLFAITVDGEFAGTAGVFSRDGDREVTFWVARHARGRGVATAALRLLVAGEAERPLYARVAADNAASVAVLQHNGFAEISRGVEFAAGRGSDVDEVVLVLMPTLDGV